jgi:cyclomaltodextrinase / maltogenic alpha-amylase / neopullulanase
MSDWTGRALYQLHSLGAAGAPVANPDPASTLPCGRGLRTLSRWLDHVADLGCGGVLLTPVFVSSTHGYDTADPFRIDQRLGDEDDFAAFAAACRARGLALVLDGVFNHVGRGFSPFRDVLAHGPRSSWASWFRLDFARDEGDGFAYRCFEGHRELVALDHRSDAVLDWAASVACHWLDRGADGWRLDAAYAIPTPFLTALSRRIRARHPTALLFGEVIHGDYAGFVAKSGLDSVTQYELYKAIWSSLGDANFFELASAFKRHRALAAAFAPIIFAGNHDVTRLATRLREPRHLAHALAILFTAPGVPCVYYGDELAWQGTKEHRAAGDDAIRPALPASTEPVDAGQARALALHKELLGLRRARPWLARADIEVLAVANRQMTYAVSAGVDALRVVLDVGCAPLPPPEGWRIVAEYPGVAVCEREPR